MTSLSLAARLLNPFLMIALPLALGVFLTRRFRTDWRLFGVGAGTFLAAQVFHIPFNAWILSPLLDRLGLRPSSQGLVLFVSFLLLGLSAGVFEESARYLSYRYWIKDARSWEGALTFGAGHGGIESILLGLVVTFAFFQALSLQGADLPSLLPAERLGLVEGQLAAYWTAPWHLILLGAVERAGTLCAHLGLAVLVLQAFTRRNIVWLFGAIAWHALLNAGTLLVLASQGPYWAEAFVTLAGLVSLGIVFALRPGRAVPLEAGRHPPAQPVPGLQPEPSRDQLEDSRYV